MGKNSTKIWPYAITSSIVLVFLFGVATIIVTGEANIQESDDYMTHYQDADANANKLIKAKMEFDKKYNIKYMSDGLLKSNATIKYSVTDKNSNPINNAKIVIATSKPETKEFNQKMDNPKVDKGIYSFDGLAFPKAGVWNIIAKVTVGKDYRFYNIKADTRIKESFEF